MSFSDLLKRPLPSKEKESTTITESTDTDIDENLGMDMNEEIMSPDGAPMNVRDVEEGCKGGSGCGTVKEGCKGGSGCGTSTEACKGGSGCGSVEEACKGGSGCGTSTEACKGGSGCGTVKEACKGGSGCGTSTEACKGGSGCGTIKEGCDEDEDDDDDDEKDEIDDDDEEKEENRDLDDFDISGMSDEDLDELEAELNDSDLDDAAGEVESVDLSPEEEREADDLMSLGATTELIKSELNVEERAAFFESAIDTQAAVYEGFLLESDVRPVSGEVVTEAKMFNKTSVRFSKEDRKKQLYAVAINVSARAHNDPDYVKYQKVLKMKRVLKKRLQKKYHNEAIKRMKVYFARLKNSKSSILSNIGKKISGKED